LNAEVLDDWMIPFATLVAVTWATLVFGFRYLPVWYRAAKRRFAPRIRARDGEFHSPAGTRVFANDAICAICSDEDDTMHGREVSFILN
jgi:hypothetical protein